VLVVRHLDQALQLLPGTPVDFAVNRSGDVVLQKATGVKARNKAPKDRFEAARGKADVKWRTQDLMNLLRG
jgi:hypothetical protein